MTFHLMRVTGFAVLAAMLMTACTDKRTDDAAQAAFESGIEVMEREVDGRIGVFALDTATGRSLSWRADERFATASTFKPLLVAAVLSEVDAGRLSLEKSYDLDGVAIQSYSPVVNDLAAGDTLTLAELCEAAITLGDNTVTNILLDEVGGPDGLTAFLRRHGDSATRLDRYETELNENAPGDERDTTTPYAMVQSLQTFLFSDPLSPASRQHLQDWLVASRTGGARLRAGLPDSWRVGDKTGTGGNGAVNNVAVAWPPGRDPILVSVFMSGSSKDTATLNALHPRIAAAVIAHLLDEEAPVR